MTTLAALAAVLLLAVAALQAALAGGAPWGSLAWGGRWRGRLPVLMRIASGVAAVALLAMALVFLARAGSFGTDWRDGARLPIWIVAAFLGLNAAGSFASPSRLERWIMGPLTALLALLALSSPFPEPGFRTAAGIG